MWPYLVVGAMLVVGRAAQRGSLCKCSRSQNILSRNLGQALCSRHPRVCQASRPHVTQTRRPVAHINALQVLLEILPLHPQESVVLHFTAPCTALSPSCASLTAATRPTNRPSTRTFHTGCAASASVFPTPSGQIARCMRDPAPIPASPCSRPRPFRRCSCKSGTPV